MADKETTKGIEMWRLLDLKKIDNPFEAATIMEPIINSESPTSLLFLLPPKLVWVGRSCEMEKNINIDYCKERGIPIVRSPEPGRAVYYDGRDTTLWFSFMFPPSVLAAGLGGRVVGNVIKRVFKRFYGISTEYIANDYRVGDSLIGMHSYLTGTHKMAVSGELALDCDFIELKKVLRFPEEKWIGKPVGSIEEWILPLRRLKPSITVQELKNNLKWGFENEFNVNFYVTDELSDAEKAIAKTLREKYSSESWLKYGKWSPVKEYGRPE